METTAAGDLISTREWDEHHGKGLHVMAVKDRTRSTIMGKEKQMGWQGMYACEADMNDAGDFKWNAQAKTDEAMEWIRRLAEKQAKEVYEVRWEIAWDSSSKVGRAMERHEIEAQILS